MKTLRIVLLSVLTTYLVVFGLLLFESALYHSLFTNPVKAARVVLFRMGLDELAYPPTQWAAARGGKEGVVAISPGNAYGGYTVFTSSYAPKAWLVDMEGNVVHEWHVPFEKAWPKPDHIAMEVPAHLRLINRLYLYPNGDLLVIYIGVGSTPFGYGMAKVDKDSNVLWTYDRKVHHDAAVDTKGSIYTLTHQIRNQTKKGLEHIGPGYFEDFLVILDQSGNVRKRISFYDAFYDSPFRFYLTELERRPAFDATEGDLLHPNTVELVTKEVAGKAPMLKEGHVLVSFRNTSLLAILDPVSETVTWAGFGPWHLQHDPRFLPDGTVVMFDNFGHFGEGGQSRVIRVSLETGGILWQYTGTKESPVFSAYHGSVDPLPNGNVLVTESLGGRIFEVTPEKEIVWDYRSPWRVDDEGVSKVPALFRGRRYSAEELTFLEE